jgi:pilus assembly protein CpaC
VTPEFVDSMDCEQVPALGPGQGTMSPTDEELYWRGYIETPNCLGANPLCPSDCQNGNCAPGSAGGFHGKEVIIPQPLKDARSKTLSPKKNVAAAAPLPSKIGTPRVQTRPTTSTVSTRTTAKGDAPTPKAGTARLPSVSGTSSRLKEPVQATLSDEPNLIGPQGYDRLR